MNGHRGVRQGHHREWSCDVDWDGAIAEHHEAALGLDLVQLHQLVAVADWRPDSRGGYDCHGSSSRGRNNSGPTTEVKWGPSEIGGDRITVPATGS